MTILKGIKEAIVLFAKELSETFETFFVDSCANDSYKSIENSYIKRL